MTFRFSFIVDFKIGFECSLQATVVWIGDEVPPVNYRSEDLIKSLNLRLGQHIFLETGDIKHQMNPLLGAPDMAVPARVVEYLTHETGILKYDSPILTLRC